MPATILPFDGMTPKVEATAFVAETAAVIGDVEVGAGSSIWYGCTLRGDLLRTVKELSESDAKFDYLVIESTGISEPLPVAQTFVMDVNDPDAQPTGIGLEHARAQHKLEHKEAEFEPLSNFARLDTLVTPGCTPHKNTLQFRILLCGSQYRISYDRGYSVMRNSSIGPCWYFVT